MNNEIELDYYNNIKLYQNNAMFKLSLDTIVLAEFIDINLKCKSIVDFCTGFAPIPLILSEKTKASIIGIDIQKDVCDIAEKNVELNNRNKQIKIVNGNVGDIANILNGEFADVVTCNPPYFKNCIKNLNEAKSIARHEIDINLEQIVKAAKFVLKNNGYLYFVHRAERIEEIIELLNKNNFRIKKIQFVYSKKDENAIIVLVKAAKNGKLGLKVLPPKYVER